ncbi:MAG: nuclear transport factor 2 family protein [bacterium]
MRILSALLFIAAAQSARAQAAPDPATRAALITAREAVWRAYFQGDSVALVQLLPEKMTAMGRDRGQIIREAQGFVKGGGRFVRMEFTNDEFFVNGNTAILWSHYVAHTTNAGRPNDMSGRAIELFVKENDRWINPHWHLDEK